MKKTLVIFWATLLFNMVVMANEQVNVTILATSDLHGVVTPWDYSSDSANPIGSLSQLATQVKAVRASEPNVILVDAGDAIQGNFVESFNNESINPMILAMNTLNYDIWVPGNHEFDFGLPVLNKAIKQFKGTALLSNINQGGSRYLPLPAYKIIEKQGVKIAFIGVTTPMVMEFAKNSDRLGDVVITNPTVEVKKVLAELQGKADAVILVSHMGLQNENNVSDTGNTDIAKANPEITAIVAGHMHVNIGREDINGVILTEPGKYGQHLSRIDLTFDKVNGHYQLVNKNSYTYDIKGMDSDTEIEKSFQPYHEKLQQNANTVIAKLSGENLVQPDQIKGIPQVQVADSGISALYQEASAYYAPADIIALQIDNDAARLDIGDIRVKDIAYNYTYKGGEITVYQMTGRDLKAYMEWVADYFNQVKEGDVTYSFNPQRRSSKYSTNDFFSNVTYVVNLSKPVGSRIQQLKFADGRDIKDDMVIRLGMNAYRMGHLVRQGGPLAGKNFPILFDSKEKYGEEEGTIRNMTIRYLQEVKKGQYIGKQMSRWHLTGLNGYKNEQDIVIKLLNEDKITIPVSGDGRYTNVASINVKDKLFSDKAEYDQALQSLQQKLVTANTEVEKQRVNDDITLIKALNSF